LYASQTVATIPSFFISCGALFSQAITATAVGTVTDPTGAVVRNAKVTIRSRQTNQARIATTDSAGKL